MRCVHHAVGVYINTVYCHCQQSTVRSVKSFIQRTGDIFNGIGSTTGVYVSVSVLRDSYRKNYGKGKIVPDSTHMWRYTQVFFICDQTDEL